MQQKPPDGASRRRTAFHRWIKSRLEYKPGVRAARYQQVRTEFLSHWPADKDQDQRNKVAAALERGEDGEPPPWDKLFEAEAAVISRLGLEALLVKHGNLGEEFAAVGGAELAAGYFARLAAPKDVAEQRNRVEQIRAEALDMLAHIQRLRIIRQGFGVMRKRVTALATFMAATFCTLILLFFLLLTQKPQVAPEQPLQPPTTQSSTTQPVTTQPVTAPRPQATPEATVTEARFYIPFATVSIILSGMLGGCISALARLYRTAWTGELAYGVDKMSHTFWALVLRASKNSRFHASSSCA